MTIQCMMIMTQIEEMPGIKVGGTNVNNIRYADDIALTHQTTYKTLST